MGSVRGMPQQLAQESEEYRVALLRATLRELRKLQAQAEDDTRHVLSQAALEALVARLMGSQLAP